MTSNKADGFTRSNENQLAFPQAMELTYYDENERRKILPKHPWHVVPEKEGRPVTSIYDYLELPVEHRLLAISHIDPFLYGRRVKQNRQSYVPVTEYYDIRRNERKRGHIYATL